jgi:hypothetical protein
MRISRNGMPQMTLSAPKSSHPRRDTKGTVLPRRRPPLPVG